MSDPRVILTQEDMDAIRGLIRSIHIQRNIDIPTILEGIVTFFQSQLADPNIELVDLFESPEVELIEKSHDEEEDEYEEEQEEEEDGMTIRQLMDILQPMNPDADAFVALFNADGTSTIFDIEEVTDNNGNAQIEIYEEEPAA
jgi:hypothetical protein